MHTAAASGATSPHLSLHTWWQSVEPTLSNATQLVTDATKRTVFGSVLYDDGTPLPCTRFASATPHYELQLFTSWEKRCERRFYEKRQLQQRRVIDGTGSDGTGGSATVVLATPKPVAPSGAFVLPWHKFILEHFEALHAQIGRERQKRALVPGARPATATPQNPATMSLELRERFLGQIPWKLISDAFLAIPLETAAAGPPLANNNLTLLTADSRPHTSSSGQRPPRPGSAAPPQVLQDNRAVDLAKVFVCWHYSRCLVLLQKRLTSQLAEGSGGGGGQSAAASSLESAGRYAVSASPGDTATADDELVRAARCGMVALGSNARGCKVFAVPMEGVYVGEVASLKLPPLPKATPVPSAASGPLVAGSLTNPADESDRAPPADHRLVTIRHGMGEFYSMDSYGFFGQWQRDVPSGWGRLVTPAGVFAQSPMWRSGMIAGGVVHVSRPDVGRMERFECDEDGIVTVAANVVREAPIDPPSGVEAKACTWIVEARVVEARRAYESGSGKRVGSATPGRRETNPSTGGGRRPPEEEHRPDLVAKFDPLDVFPDGSSRRASAIPPEEEANPLAAILAVCARENHSSSDGSSVRSQTSSSSPTPSTTGLVRPGTVVMYPPTAVLVPEAAGAAAAGALPIVRAKAIESPGIMIIPPAASSSSSADGPPTILPPAANDPAGESLPMTVGSSLPGTFGLSGDVANPPTPILASAASPIQGRLRPHVVKVQAAAADDVLGCATASPSAKGLLPLPPPNLRGPSPLPLIDTTSPEQQRVDEAREVIVLVTHDEPHAHATMLPTGAEESSPSSLVATQQPAAIGSDRISESAATICDAVTCADAAAVAGEVRAVPGEAAAPPTASCAGGSSPLHPPTHGGNSRIEPQRSGAWGHDDLSRQIASAGVPGDPPQRPCSPSQPAAAVPSCVEPAAPTCVVEPPPSTLQVVVDGATTSLSAAVDPDAAVATESPHDVEPRKKSKKPKGTDKKVKKEKKRETSLEEDGEDREGKVTAAPPLRQEDPSSSCVKKDEHVLLDEEAAAKKEKREKKERRAAKNRDQQEKEERGAMALHSASTTLDPTDAETVVCLVSTTKTTVGAGEDAEEEEARRKAARKAAKKAARAAALTEMVPEQAEATKLTGVCHISKGENAHSGALNSDEDGTGSKSLRPAVPPLLGGVARPAPELLPSPFASGGVGVVPLTLARSGRHESQRELHAATVMPVLGDTGRRGTTTTSLTKLPFEGGSSSPSSPTAAGEPLRRLSNSIGRNATTTTPYPAATHGQGSGTPPVLDPIQLTRQQPSSGRVTSAASSATNGVSGALDGGGGTSPPLGSPEWALDGIQSSTPTGDHRAAAVSLSPTAGAMRRPGSGRGRMSAAAPLLPLEDMTTTTLAVTPNAAAAPLRSGRVASGLPQGKAAAGTPT